MGLSVGGGKNKTKSVQSQTNTLDPYMEEIRRLLGQAGIDAANAPPPTMDGSIGEAQGIYKNVANLGLGGMNALAGDADAVAKLMNPYQQQVIDATNKQFDRLRGEATVGVNDMATKAGAFGGSRHGVALGTTLGNLYSTQGQTIAGLNAQGFDAAMQRAANLSNLGLGATGSMAGLGQYATEFNAANSPERYRFDILGQLTGLLPYTTNSKSRGTQSGYNMGVQAGFGKFAGR